MRPWALAAALILGTATALAAQGRPQLRVERADGSSRGVSVELGQGYAAVPAGLLSELGWSVTQQDRVLTLGLADEITVALSIGSPYFRWDDIVLQMADAPYLSGREAYVPLQLLTDFFPRRLPDLYDFDGPSSTLRAGDPADRGSEQAADPASEAPEGAAPERMPPPSDQPSAYEGVRVVIVDAGHGGADPGAMGPSGIREKDVALGIALGVAEILRGRPDLEVHMIRDDDTFVDLWERGQIATNLRGERPGIFVSIHANSFPTRRAATGFETYFLSEARTEHERRVAAIENAPLSIGGQDVDAEAQPDLASILGDLRNLDHQHWSALLAEMVQGEMDRFHPGPNRGVKQGVLAVLTNALMPSVLVEVGYLSNADEGRLLGNAEFQADAASAIASAVGRFFERYPPGNGLGGRERP